MLSPARIDFSTHYIYVTTLEKLSRGLLVSCKADVKVTPERMKRAAGKLQLIRLTQQSIRNELQIVEADEEYSTASVLWLPIKTYYSIYHLLSVIDFMISGDPSSLTIGHGEFADRFSRRLERRELILSEARFNIVFDEGIFGFREVSGQHLRAEPGDDLIHTLVMKKIAAYKLENRRLSFGWNLRLKADQERQRKYLSKMKVSIFDFFYLMRIKSNYRGINFIEDIPAADTARYFRAYFQTALNFFECFGKLRNELLREMEHKTSPK